MTIILIAVGMFGLGLAMVLMFRRAVSADEELERRWGEVVADRSRRAEAERRGTSDQTPGPLDPAAPSEPTARGPGAN